MPVGCGLLRAVPRVCRLRSQFTAPGSIPRTRVLDCLLLPPAAFTLRCLFAAAATTTHTQFSCVMPVTHTCHARGLRVRCYAFDCWITHLLRLRIAQVTVGLPCSCALPRTLPHGYALLYYRLPPDAVVSRFCHHVVPVLDYPARYRCALFWMRDCLPAARLITFYVYVTVARLVGCRVYCRVPVVWVIAAPVAALLRAACRAVTGFNVCALTAQLPLHRHTDYRILRTRCCCLTYTFPVPLPLPATVCRTRAARITIPDATAVTDYFTLPAVLPAGWTFCGCYPAARSHYDTVLPLPPLCCCAAVSCFTWLITMPVQVTHLLHCCTTFLPQLSSFGLYFHAFCSRVATDAVHCGSPRIAVADSALPGCGLCWLLRLRCAARFTSRLSRYGSLCLLNFALRMLRYQLLTCCPARCPFGSLLAAGFPHACLDSPALPSPHAHCITLRCLALDSTCYQCHTVPYVPYITLYLVPSVLDYCRFLTGPLHS